MLMSESTLETQWQDLLNLFRLSDSLTEQVLIERIRALALSDDLCHALICSIQGNNRIINEYLFDLSVTYQKPIAWIAPVIINGNKRYAWMIGQVSSEISEVRSRFDGASARVRDDSILRCDQEPKPLMFIEPLAVSDFSESAQPNGFETDTIVDDFAVFQVGYKEVNGDIADFDQRLVLNATLLEKNFKTAINRAKTVISGLPEADNCLLEQQAKLLAMLHAEAHNRGHFAGSWPFDKYKTCLLHEAVEEFRACLNAIKWAEYLNLSNHQTNLFAFAVFAVRFFHYGYRAYVDPIKTHQSIRETSVALMFFETLLQSGVLCVDLNEKIFHQFELNQLRLALIAASARLNQQELEAKNKGIDGLREVGRYWYKIAYPNSNISPEAQSIFTHLRDFSTV